MIYSRPSSPALLASSQEGIKDEALFFGFLLFSASNVVFMNVFKLFYCYIYIYIYT